MASRPHGAAAAAMLAGWLLLSGTPAADGQDSAEIDNGRYLAAVGDCAACHTAPGSGFDMAGGRPIETPFGTVVASNITPDAQTGIGAWSADDFVAALTQGIGRGGKHLYPAMPYTYYTRVSKQDALAIRAYLATLPAVRHKVVSNRLPFPFDVRAAMIGWNAVNFRPGPFHPNDTKSAAWNRGAYLVEGLGHCGLCHTPKTALGGDKITHRLQGGSAQGWFAPDITDNPVTGLGGWSVEQIVRYLHTGHNATAAAGGPMGEEVTISSSTMREADLEAIAAYLKDLPSTPTDYQRGMAPAPPSGAAIYADRCAACHGQTGAGVPGLFPTLKGSPAVMARDSTSLLHVVLAGADGVATTGAPTGSGMPAFAWLLSDSQAAAVTTYVRNAWGNAASGVSSDDVAHMRRRLTAGGG